MSSALLFTIILAAGGLYILITLLLTIVRAVILWDKQESLIKAVQHALSSRLRRWASVFSR